MNTFTTAYAQTLLSKMLMLPEGYKIIAAWSEGQIFSFKVEIPEGEEGNFPPDVVNQDKHTFCADYNLRENGDYWDCYGSWPWDSSEEWYVCSFRKDAKHWSLP